MAIRLLQRNFASGQVVCLLANSHRADQIGAQLMNTLKHQLNFIGSGGPLMQQQGLKPLYGLQTFHPQPFVPFRSVDVDDQNYWLWLRYNPFTRKYSKSFQDTLKVIKQKNIIQKIRGYRPSLILTLDHDVLSMKIHKQIAELFKNTSSLRPKQIHYGKFVNYTKIKNLEHLDHVFYTMPLPAYNFNKFTFPSTYIGQRAFYNAYEFLLERNGGQHLLRKNSVFVSKDHFYSETEEFIEAERHTFRNTHGISPQATVFFFSPGNRPENTKWSLPILHKTANQFIQESEESPQNFVVVISNSAPELATLNFSCRVIVAEDEQTRRSALAGSDLAVCYNGEVVSECLVNQLTTVVIQNMSKVEFYTLLAWNRFTNDMNIIADGNLFPEIIEGQCSPNKLVEILKQWHESPPHKFWPLQHFEMHLNRMLPMKSRDLGMGIHHEYHSPSYLLAESILAMAKEAPARRFAEEENYFINEV